MVRQGEGDPGADGVVPLAGRLHDLIARVVDEVGAPLDAIGAGRALQGVGELPDAALGRRRRSVNFGRNFGRVNQL